MTSNKNSERVRLVPVSSDHAGQRLDNFLSGHLKGVPRSAVYRMIRTGQVRINGGRARAASRLAAGDTVRIPPARVRGERSATVSERVRNQLRQAVLFENPDLLVVDKPAGMAVHAGSGLPWGLIDALRQDRPGEYLELVHRLDRETSGCLVLARSGPALAHLSARFREGAVRKFYLCLMCGRMPQAALEVDAPLARRRNDPEGRVGVDEMGKASLTRFRLLRRYGEYSYVEAELLTGRTHQIRAHALHLGLPLAGDPKYADRNSLKDCRKIGLSRVFLHAHRLALESPAGEGLDFEAPLPDALRRVLDTLEG
jgi:23S rRNA pseudouridine955/2504/2580 synthase